MQEEQELHLSNKMLIEEEVQGCRDLELLVQMITHSKSIFLMILKKKQNCLVRWISTLLEHKELLRDDNNKEDYSHMLVHF